MKRRREKKPLSHAHSIQKTYDEIKQETETKRTTQKKQASKQACT